MKKSTIMLAAVLAGIGAQASVVVQWGENLVTNAVVASTVSFDNVPTTTYTDNQADAMAGTGYYALNTGARSPIFQASAGSTQTAQIQDNASYDRIRMVGTSATAYETMVVWNDFLTSDRELTSLGWGGYQSGTGASTDIRFVVQQGGNWYATTVATTKTGAATTYIAVDATTASWSSFTPLTAGVGTLGAVVPGLTLTNVTAVGFWSKHSVGTAVLMGLQTGYFQAEAIPEPATLGMVAAFGGAVMFIRRRFMI